MKTNISLLLVLLFSSFTLPAQTTTAPTYITNKSYFASKGLAFVPGGSYVNAEGTLRSVQAFFISNEISNRDFRAFADAIVAHPDSVLKYFLRGDQGVVAKTISYADIKKQLIDSAAMWRYFANEPDKQLRYKNYFSDKNFDNFPVVGVSAQTAKYYCVWKTNQEIADLRKNGKGLINDFRLPEQDELDYARSLTPLESTNYNTAINEVNKGTKDNLGIYHLFDNVEEITSGSEGATSRAPKGFRMVCTYLGK